MLNKTYLPLVAALCLFAGCADDDDDGSANETSGSGSTTDSSSGSTTGDDTTTTGDDTTTGGDDTTTGGDDSTTDDGADGSESGGGTAGGSSSGGDSSGSGGETGTGSTGEPAATCPDDFDVSEETIEIAGCYVDEHGSLHLITDDTWFIYGLERPMSAFDNDDDYAVVQNPEEDEYNPELFARHEWFVDGDSIYYCSSVLDAATADDAIAAAPADDQDLDTGCNGFPWSLLNP